MRDRKELRKRLGGDVQFTDEYISRKTMHCRIFRSDEVHARIRGIDIPILPEGYEVITARDLPSKLFTLFDSTYPLLAEHEIQFRGQPVLLLIGPDYSILQRISRDIHIYYQELPLLEDKIHLSSTHITGKEQTGGSIFESILDLPPREPMLPQPQAILVKSTKKKISVSGSSPWPGQVIRCLCDYFKLPPGDISYNSKEIPYNQGIRLYEDTANTILAAVASLLTKKSILLKDTRKESILYKGKSPSVRGLIRSRVNDDGKLMSSEIDLYVDMGAVPVLPQEYTGRIIQHFMSLYHVSRRKIAVHCLKSNHPPMSAVYAYGGDIVQIIVEKHLNDIAYSKQISPIELRKHNMQKKGMKTSWGELRRKPHSGKQLLDKLNNTMQFERRYSSNGAKGRIQGKTRGIGLALASQQSGFATSVPQGKVQLTLTQESKLIISISNTLHTPLINAIKLQLSGILGVQLEHISVAAPKYPENPDSGPRFFSLSLMGVVKALKTCAKAIQKKRFHQGLPLTEQRSIKKGKQGIQLENGIQLLQPMGESIAAAAVEVEYSSINRETEIINIWCITDAGEIYDLMEISRILAADMRNAALWTLIEDASYFNGRIFSEQVADLHEAMCLETPLPEIRFYDSPLSPQGISCLGGSVIPAALISAYEQAVSGTVTGLPLRNQHPEGL